jgi:hypothetical protein
MRRILAVLSMSILPAIAWGTGQDTQSGTSSLAPVQGEACYQYGDNETPIQAKTVALNLAKQRAIESHQVFVESASRVANFQLTDDVVNSLSRAHLRQMKVIKEDQQGQKICTAITALLDPAEVTSLINQRINAKEVAQAVQTPLLSKASDFRLKVWTNKEEGTFREGERLVISVWSDQEAYLKLDYYQANGEVVHLVPNLFADQAFIRAGQTYTFGGADSSYDFVVRPPFGAEAIKVLASTRPFEKSLIPSSPTADAREYLQALERGVRGIAIEARSNGGSTSASEGQGAAPKLAEATASLVTQEKGD